MSPIFPTIKITLHERGEVELVPSAGAGMRIARHFGGFAEAHKKLAALDPDAFTSIIQLGGAINDRKSLEDQVFYTGILHLLEPLVEYVFLLGSAGKTTSEQDQAEDKEAGKGAK